MKVIDLLNKIANGEEVPKEIKVNDNIFHYDETDCNEFYRYKTMENELLTDYYDLNDEVEIIEDTPKENKKIEKISLDDWVEFTTPGDIKRIDYMFNQNCSTFVAKINEIIETLNKKQ